ncbi:MAG: hypothetical protein JJT90_11585 [Ectothiorhodospiraceae bacterium]|nr:hypothetical protein [Ectothiorhodospiraceae bacterium]
MTERSSRRSGRWPLILVLAIFFVPAGIAWTLFFTGWVPDSTGNHGELLEPHQLQPVIVDADGQPVTASRLRGKWTMLLLQSGPCGADCQSRLVDTRQVRLALAQNADRTQRVLILPEGEAPPAGMDAHRDLQVYWATGPVLPEGAPAAGAVSLLDSRGYRMMRYAEPLDAGGLLSDLKHLIRLSNIDLERLHGLSEDAVE